MTLSTEAMKEVLCADPSRPAIRHQVIMVSGASPGAGKSTLSAMLAHDLTQHGIPTNWLSEDDLLELELFARFDQELGNNDLHAIDSLFKGARTLFANDDGTGRMWITDALLPGFFWLLGRYPIERVAAFGDALARLLRPLQPIIVYLAGDVAELFGRAISKRGLLWGERMIAAFQRWDLPYYPEMPLRDLDDVVRFLEWLNRHTLALLAAWPGETLILDTTHTPVPELKERLLTYLYRSEQNLGFRAGTK